MKKGFTLIELLAVIVILAIIALIAVPIVLNIISDSKKSSDEQSVELYIDAVEKAITKKQLSSTNFSPKECKIQKNGNLLCDEVEVSVDMKGKIPEDGVITLSNNKIYYKGLKLNEKYYTNVVNLISDEDSDGKLSVGDKYSYKVNDNDIFNFYVLSIEDNQVNLIMDRNICGDGTTNYTQENNYCRLAWHGPEANNNYGPDIAMKTLYNATKDWDNVSDMMMEYYDEDNYNSETDGYTSIITDEETKITVITPKQNKKTENQMFGNVKEPLKSRLPKYSEVISENFGCYDYRIHRTDYAGSCPYWLVSNLSYDSDYLSSNCSECLIKYEMNNNDEVYQNKIYGYWILTSWNGNNVYAGFVWYQGFVTAVNSDFLGYNGIRPVITVPREYLE